MDDMTDFERRLADDLVRLAGPRRPVDATAITRSVTTAARSRPWSIVTRRAQPPEPGGRAEGRSRTMFGLFRYAAAAAIVALVGGYLLTSLPRHPADLAPAAERPADLAPSGAEMVVPPEPTGYQLVRDGRGDVWALGDRLMRFSDEDGTLTLAGEWTLVDDAAFAGNWMMAPARDRGVWLVGFGSSIRHFDGTRFADVIDAPAGGVTGLAEAPDGSLWAAASGGVMRWDGSSWNDMGVAYEADILGIDAQGGVWVIDGTDTGPTIEGVSRLDGTSWQSYGPEDHPRLGGLDFGPLQVAPNGTVYLPANGALLAFDGQTWTELSGAPYMAEPGLTSVGPDGTFWLADGEAIYSRSPDGSLETVDDPAGGLSDIAGLVALSDGALVSTTGRLHRLRDGTMATIWQVGSQAGPNGNVFPSMIATDSGAWIGDETGVWRCPAPATVDGCRLMDEGMPELRGDEGVSVALAPDGTLWATGPGGTARLDGEAWEVVGDAPGQAVTVGPDGTVWVLGFDNALAAWRDGPAGWVAEHHPPTGLICAGCGVVAWMGVRPDGSVWVLQLGFVPVYLLSFDGQTWTRQLESDVAGRPIGPFGNVHAATIDAGGHLWVVWSGPPVDEHGLPTNGVARLDDTGWTVVSEAEPAGFGGVVAGPDGSVWMGSDDGLLRWDGTDWEPAGLAGMPVTPVDVSADGAVWFIDGGAGTTALYRLPAEP